MTLCELLLQMCGLQLTKTQCWKRPHRLADILISQKKTGTLRQMKWLAHSASKSLAPGCEPNSPGPASIVVSKFTTLLRLKGCLPDYSRPKRPSTNNPKHICHQPEARLESSSPDTDGLTVFNTGLCHLWKTSIKKFSDHLPSRQKRDLFWGIF